MSYSTAQLVDQCAQYRHEGYLIARNVVERELIDQACEHLWETVKAHEGVPFEILHQRPLWFDDPFYLRIARHPALLDIAGQILGPDLALFAAGYIIKPPTGGPAVLWHQDGAYWPLDPMEVCTLWLALSPSTCANGCMRVIPRTHHLELQQLKERNDVVNLLGSGMDSSLVDESQAVNLELRPGDVSVHHPNIVHGSNANASGDQWRLNLVIRVIAASTRVTDPTWRGVFRLRGRQRDDINRYLPGIA